MDRETARSKLPAPYATALQLEDDGTSREDIACRLGIDRNAIASFFALAEAKLAAIQMGREGELSPDRRSDVEGDD